MNDREYTLRVALERIAEDRAVYAPELQGIARTALESVAGATRDEENAAKLQEIGESAFASITEMVAALECDYERLEELRDLRKAESMEGTPQTLAEWDADNGEELKELESAAGDCKDRESAENRILEDALSVEVRTDWYNPHNDPDPPAEFSILLGTGGPAVRIIGELNEHGEPTSATLQTQDWFLPWTDYRDADEETLLTYCRCFYFREG